MLKKLLSALTGLMLFVSMPLAALAAERYEILQVGDEDAWVMELQEKLNELGYLNVPATGYYGTNTQNAVIRYQQDHGLAADGKAGPVTRKSILGDAYREITGPRESGVDISGTGNSGSTVSGELTRPGTSSSAAPPALSSVPDSGTAGEPSAPTNSGTAPAVPEQTPSGSGGDVLTQPELGLQLGDKGDAVTRLQEKLRDYDFYDYGSITGYYGPVTKEAVERFERSNGLEVDGAMSPADLAVLNSDTCQYYTMRVGDDNDSVRDLQLRLKELGYISGSATGYYGTVTAGAVEQFQINNGLSADGMAGKETRDLLFSDKAIAVDGVVPPVDPGTEDPNPDQDPNITDPGADTDPDAPPEQLEPGLPGSENPGDSPAADGDSGSEAPGSGNAGDENPGGEDPGGEDAGNGNSGDGEEPGASSGVAKMLEVAESRVGKPYVYGASGPNSFDCSGFVYYCLKGAGVNISRMSSASYATVSSWEPVKNKSSLRVGDLVFFKSDSSSSISHVGIYLGGGNFIHSAPSSGGVGYSTMSSGYYSRNFVSARRVFS